jgi:hypothetical protein
MDEAKALKSMRNAFKSVGELVAAKMVEEMELKGPLLQPKSTYVEQKMKGFEESFEAMVSKMKTRAAKASIQLHEKILLLPGQEKTGSSE